MVTWSVSVNKSTPGNYLNLVDVLLVIRGIHNFQHVQSFKPDAVGSTTDVHFSTFTEWGMFLYALNNQHVLLHDEY